MEDILTLKTGIDMEKLISKERDELYSEIVRLQPSWCYDDYSKLNRILEKILGGDLQGFSINLFCAALWQMYKHLKISSLQFDELMEKIQTLHT